VRAAIEASCAGPDSLELEITETLVMEDIKAAGEALRLINNMGVNIAVDDFGTGYSSLHYLAKLPVDTLKIDRSFVVTMTTDPDSMAIVSTIISLAHTLGMKVVAEGVDAEEQTKYLKMMKCDEMQGYLFSRPLAAPQLIELLRQQTELGRAKVAGA
jgi:EAL domain-containing protein (putative c-di-GMP-specific phosphodiesterase class I)